MCSGSMGDLLDPGDPEREPPSLLSHPRCHRSCKKGDKPASGFSGDLPEVTAPPPHPERGEVCHHTHGRGHTCAPSSSCPQVAPTVQLAGEGCCICFLDKSPPPRFKPGAPGGPPRRRRRVTHAQARRHAAFVFFSDSISTRSHVLEPRSYSHGNGPQPSVTFGC